MPELGGAFVFADDRLCQANRKWKANIRFYLTNPKIISYVHCYCCCLSLFFIKINNLQVTYRAYWGKYSFNDLFFSLYVACAQTICRALKLKYRIYSTHVVFPMMEKKVDCSFTFFPFFVLLLFVTHSKQIVHF